MDLGGSLGPLRSFPPNGAVLRIWHNEFGPASPVHEDDASLPLLLSDLHRIDPYEGGSEPTPLFAGVNGDGVTYAVAVWFGPSSSPRDRAAITRALASLRFPPTRAGTTVADRLIVLGTPGTWSVGSVTRFDRADLFINQGPFAAYKGPFSFFLVRGTSGFYGVATHVLGNGSRCELVVKPDYIQFACTMTGPVWNRFGRVVIPPASPPADGQEDLLILPAPRSWDGNLMIDPFGNWPEAAIDAWR